jgi:hypothetical protein
MCHQDAWSVGEDCWRQPMRLGAWVSLPGSHREIIQSYRKALLVREVGSPQAAHGVERVATGHDSAGLAAPAVSKTQRPQGHEEEQGHKDSARFHAALSLANGHTPTSGSW